MLEFDHLLFQKINIIWTHPLADGFFGYITDLHQRKFVSLFLFPLLVLACLIKFKKRALLILVGVVSCVFLSDATSHRVFKPMFQRERPNHALEETVLRTHPHGGWSFPSTHATNFFAGATFLYLFLPQWIGLFLFLLATLVAYSRVYLGVHYPLDVTAGALLGIALGVCWYMLYGKLVLYMKSKRKYG